MVVTGTRLEAGMDFRRVEYREEVFLRFYQFHLQYKSHPGAVYYVMPYLAAEEGWGTEEKLWFAYLNGNTQNPVTSYIIFKNFPVLADVDIDKMDGWFKNPAVYGNLLWDTDRRYHKSTFIQNVAQYQQLTSGPTGQAGYFHHLCGSSPYQYDNFRIIWDMVKNGFRSFGRLSTFSYLEYLRIMGLPLDCDQLFLDDMQGSRSHRNGLCKVTGRDDLDWHGSNPSFTGDYTAEQLKGLEIAGERLLRDAKERAMGQTWLEDVSYFTLESALCTYKSWHRKNRRYPNVYNDLLHDRITHAQQRWIRPRLDIFWEARRAYLPPNLRLEDNPLDVGCSPLKQNHYRQTGQVIMMERDWDCFKNDYADRFITA